MRKTLKILGILPVILLASCNGSSKELNENEAKEYLVTMQNEITKDTFVMPTKGMIKSNVTINSQGSSIVTTQDTRFDNNSGTRYFYSKIQSMLLSGEYYLYEKDGKYYYYTSTLGETSQQEISTEEFDNYFDGLMSENSLDISNFKEVINENLEMIKSFYNEKDEDSSSSSGDSVTYDFKFIQYNDSSFKFEGNGNIKSDNGQSLKANLAIEYKDYLPMNVVLTTNGSLDSSIGTAFEETITQNYVWGSVDYLYPTV